jgi:hypothetical protein
LGNKKEESLRGDKLRELILWVYLHNKYEKGKIKMSFLREKVGYHGPGGSTVQLILQDTSIKRMVKSL